MQIISSIVHRLKNYFEPEELTIRHYLPKGKKIPSNTIRMTIRNVK